MQVRDRFRPDVGGKRIAVDVKPPVLVANRLHPSRANVVGNGRIMRRHRAERVRAAVRRARRPDALDDIRQRRIDVVGALALDPVPHLHDGARTRIDGQRGVGRVYRVIGVDRLLRRHVRPARRLRDEAVGAVIREVRPQTRIACLGLDLPLAVPVRHVRP